MWNLQSGICSNSEIDKSKKIKFRVCPDNPASFELREVIVKFKIEVQIIKIPIL